MLKGSAWICLGIFSSQGHAQSPRFEHNPHLRVTSKGTTKIIGLPGCRLNQKPDCAALEMLSQGKSLEGSWTAGRLLQAGIGTSGRSREQQSGRNRSGDGGRWVRGCCKAARGL